ncbi:MAG: flagellar hook-associated protein FlgL, partial [Nitrospirae bacterium]|nr:flagellar hook-associated protein FlgL [Nitrospirota bacterium]
MRVTSQMFYTNFLSGLQQNLTTALKDSDQISSGVKINKPSDDPSTLWKIVDYQTQLSNIGQYQRAIDAAKAPIQSLDSALSNLNDNLNRANELAVSAGNGTMDANSRLMISDEVNGLFDSTVSIANTKLGDRYLFAGYQSNTAPVNATTGELQGDTSLFKINISAGVSINANVSAGSLFSFKRVNAADSTTAILPTYNWTNNGANTIPDADPVSALQTAAPTDPAVAAYTINPNDTISINGTSVNLNSGSSPIAFNANGFAARLQASIQAGGGALAGVTVSYDTASNKFKIGGAAVSVNWQGSATTTTPTTFNIEKALGFDSSGDQAIGAGTSIASDNTVGKFTASDNIFTANGGAFNIKVNNSASTAQSEGAFVINSTNNAITLNNTTYYIASGTYTGAGLAKVLQNKLSLSPTGSPAIAAPIINVSYDSS